MSITVYPLEVKKPKYDPDKPFAFYQYKSKAELMWALYQSAKTDEPVFTKSNVSELFGKTGVIDIQGKRIYIGHDFVMRLHE